MIDKIFTGTDKAKELGYDNYREMIVILAEQTGKYWSGEWSDSKVYARIDFGRWIADCECGGASYVDYDDDIFYCAMCGNQSTQGKARHVIFPADDFREKIEQELLRRKVKSRYDLFGTGAAMNSYGVISRSWNPGETLEQLIDQRERTEHVL